MASGGCCCWASCWGAPCCSRATLAVEHFWQFVFLIPAILVALGMFVLQHHVGSFAQLYRRRLDGASYLLVSCGIALVLGKLCVLLLA